MIMSRSPGMV